MQIVKKAIAELSQADQKKVDEILWQNNLTFNE